MAWDIKGKRVLVTGATSGIGRAAAQELTKQGADVVIVGRNPVKTDLVASEIREKTGRKPEFLLADFASRKAVESLAAGYKKRYGSKLDVLINNAGVYYMKRELSADGFEMTMAVNHLAPFLLTTLLLDCLKASAPSRIINVSSRLHRGAKLNVEDLNLEKGFSGWTAYANSKLANILFTKELAARLEGSGVTANALHPGFVSTGLSHNNDGFVQILFGGLQKLLGMSPENGADTIVYLATTPDLNTTGGYFDKRREQTPGNESNNRDLRIQLWQKSEELMKTR